MWFNFLAHYRENFRLIIGIKLNINHYFEVLCNLPKYVFELFQLLKFLIVMAFTEIGNVDFLIKNIWAIFINLIPIDRHIFFTKYIQFTISFFVYVYYIQTRKKHSHLNRKTSTEAYTTTTCSSKAFSHELKSEHFKLLHVK